MSGQVLVVRGAVATLLAGVALGACVEPAGAAPTVSTAAEFQAAVSRYRDTGGTIVLRRGVYPSPLVVGARSARRLTIRGEPGARIHSLVLSRAQAVTVRDLTVRPVGRDGGILSSRSRGIVLRGLRFTAVASPHRVSLDLDRSTGVTIAGSSFSHCGDAKLSIAPCLLPRGASHVTVRGNRFHSCRGCDFIHGRPGRKLVIERNRFERAPRCVGVWSKCGHQDAIEFFAGDGVIIRRNVFEATGRGRAQIYLSRSAHRVTIVNNVFLPNGGRTPGVTPRRGIQVGSRVSRDLPRNVRILHNTVLTGSNANDDESASLVISPFYEDVPRSVRPLVANNVFARLRASHVCGRLRHSTRNVAARGRPCRREDFAGDPLLAPDGRPTGASELVIDRAAPAFSPPADLSGRSRVGPPDIGAYEFVP